MAATKIVVVIFSVLFVSLTLSHITSANESTKHVNNVDDDEDLSFLEEPKPPKDYPDYADPHFRPNGAGGDELAASYEAFQAYQQDHRQPPPLPDVDEKDVVVLNKTTFEDFVNKTKYSMVEFYAPWCGYCHALAPDYAAAATELKQGGSDVVLAKVDATAETELGDKYKIDGFPTMFLFTHGEHIPYNGDRTKDGIVSWLKKKTGFAVKNVTTTVEAEKIVAHELKLVVAYVDSLNGSDSLEFNAAAKLEDDLNFYQTNSPDVAKVFQFDANTTRPSVVLLKKEHEKLSQFDGNFTKSDIRDFVSANKNPLVTILSKDNAPLVFESPSIHKQVYLFATAAEAEKLISPFQEAAKSFKGKLMFVHVERDNEEHGRPLVDYFSIEGDIPRVLAFTGLVNGKKFLFDGEITLEKLKSFAEDFIADKLKQFYKSDPIPETNDGDVKIVVGKNFDTIVLDESKDVLLEIYAPWCPHCVNLEPTYNRLARHLRGIDSLVVAKMDGTRNEHPLIKVDGFPTILFFPAGKKTSDPIVAHDSEVTAVALYKFIKKHATTPFKIQKPGEPQPPLPEHVHHTTHETVASIKSEAGSNDLNDEL